MKALPFFLGFCLLTYNLFPQNESDSIYDLRTGTTRYYYSCGALGIPCIGDGSYTIATERVVDKTIIKDKSYSIILFEKFIHREQDNSNSYFADTLLQIVIDKKLYQRSSDQDSLIADFNFSKGDSLHWFFDAQSRPGSYDILPPVVIYDTILNFPDGNDRRIVWSDDTTWYSQIPDEQTFIDSILISSDNWLLPSGSTNLYGPVHPFYFIEGFGIVKNIFTHLSLPMIGIRTSDGVLYGEEFKITGIQKEQITDFSFSLSQNYPNPFNPTTRIQYTIGSKQFICLSLYDVLGREIETLVNEEKHAGEYEVEFDGTGLSSGVYFYSLKSQNYFKTNKMILLQ